MREEWRVLARWRESGARGLAGHWSYAIVNTWPARHQAAATCNFAPYVSTCWHMSTRGHVSICGHVSAHCQHLPSQTPHSAATCNFALHVSRVNTRTCDNTRTCVHTYTIVNTWTRTPQSAVTCNFALYMSTHRHVFISTSNQNSVPSFSVSMLHKNVYPLWPARLYFVNPEY